MLVGPFVASWFRRRDERGMRFDESGVWGFPVKYCELLPAFLYVYRESGQGVSLFTAIYRTVWDSCDLKTATVRFLFSRLPGSG